MKIFRNFIKLSLVMLFVTGCNMASRETFDLNYQEQHIMYTLGNGPLKTIKPNGEFDQILYDQWDFNQKTMELIYSEHRNLTVTKQERYSVEVIKDISRQEGIVRVFGNGSFDGKYIGVSAHTNGAGAFLKFSIQPTEDNAIENATAHKYWQLATNPIIFRLHTLYPNKRFVSLDNEEFYVAEDHIAFTVDTEFNVDGTQRRVVQFYDIVAGVESTGEKVTFLSTQLLPLFHEVYDTGRSGAKKFLAVEFAETPGDTRIKLAEGATREDALSKVRAMTIFNYQLLENADRPNRVIKATQGIPLVFLTKSASAVAGDGLYFWEGTRELTFNPAEMTLTEINTFSPTDPTKPLGITNIYNYTIKMLEDTSATSGIFSIKGTGSYNGMVGALRVYPEADGIFADFSVDLTVADAKTSLNNFNTTPTKNYRDLNTAIRPYRLIEKLADIGQRWVELIEIPGTDGMQFDPKNTESYDFYDLNNRRLKYTSIRDSSVVDSFYSVKIVLDVNDTNGVFQLTGYTDDTFTTVDPTKPMHGVYVAVDRGTELYQTQAKYAKSAVSLNDAIEKRNNVGLFNLHERSSIPSNYRVIAQMEKFGPWVALVYGSLDPGEITTAVGLNDQPFFEANNTHRWLFDTTSGLQVTITVVQAGTADRIATYSIIPIKDVSETYGIFQLQILSGNDTLGYHDKFLAIKTGSGALGDRGYIGVGITEADAIVAVDAINNPSRLLRNYNAESTAPVSPRMIQKIDGVRYIEFVTNGSGTPTGSIKPFDTKIYTFNHGTLTLVIETIRPNNATPLIESYKIQMRRDESEFSGVFQLSGDGLALNRQFMRLDVQSGANVGQKIRILRDLALEPLEGGTVAAIANMASLTTAEATHGQEAREVVAGNVLNTMFGAGSAPTVIPNASTIGVASVDAVDRMYDFKNHEQLLFDLSRRELSIVRKVNNVETSRDTYTYVVLTNDTTTAGQAKVILKLAGSGPRANDLLGVKRIGTEQKVFITYGTVFNNTMTALAANTSDEYVIPTFPWNATLTAAFKTLGDEVGLGFGPSFVLMKNSTYDPNDTERWTFNTADYTVRVIHNNTLGGVIQSYNVYMQTADAIASAGAIRTINNFVVYLKGANGAPYHNKYVHLKNYAMSGAAPGDETTFLAGIGDTASAATTLADSARLSFRDLRSATIPAGAIDRAAAFEWVNVASFLTAPPADAQYQRNNAAYEIWKFRDGGANTVTVTDQAGTSRVYNYVPRDDTSTHRGEFSLVTRPGTPAGPYNNHAVVIGIGGETKGASDPYDYGTAFDSRSMRVGVEPIVGGDLTAAFNAARAKRDALPEWNFRANTDASLPFDPIQSAADIDDANVGWVQLKAQGDDYIYDSTDTMRLRFVPSSPQIANVAGSVVYDVLISHTATAPTTSDRFGLKLIQTVTDGKTAIFQLFRKNQAGVPSAQVLSNKFIQLELGQGLDIKSMRLAIGDTEEQARQNFARLGTKWNWYTHDKATVNILTGVAKAMADLGQWTLTRNDTTDDTGSSIESTGGDVKGLLAVQANGTGKPTFNPNDNLDFLFNPASGFLSIRNIRSAADLNIPYISYQLVPVEDISGIAGVFILKGTGAFGDKFVYFEMAEAVVSGNANTGRRGRMSIANTLDQVKAINAQLRADNRYNFFASEWIKVNGQVFEQLSILQKLGWTVPGSEGAFVALGYQEPGTLNVYDPTLTRTYTVLFNVAGYEPRSIIISNVSPASTRDDLYEYEMVESITVQDFRAIAVLKGSGPDRGKYIGVRLYLNGTQATTPHADLAEIFVASQSTDQVAALAEVKAAIQWTTPSITVGNAHDFYRYRRIYLEHSTTGAATALQNMGAGGKVLLDSDSIYLHDNTYEWNFSPSSLQATAVKREPGQPDVSVIYKMIPVRISQDSANRGMFYLKSSNPAADFDGQYVGVLVDGARARFYIRNTLNDASTAAFHSSFVAYPYNLVLRSDVYFPEAEPIFNALARKSNGRWSSLTAEYNVGVAANTTNLTFNNALKTLTVTIAGTAYNARFRILTNEAATPNTKSVFQIIKDQLVVPALPAALENTIWAVELDELDDPISFKATHIAGTFDAPTMTSALFTARDALTDPNYLERNLFIIDKRSLNTWNNVSRNEWRQIGEDGNLLGAGDNTVASWEALPVADRPWTYDMNPLNGSSTTGTPDGRNFALGSARGSRISRSIEVNGASTERFIGSRILLLEDGGNRRGLFKLYRRNTIDTASSANPLPAVYDTDIYNRYHAFSIGDGVDTFRARITRAATPEQANIALNSLQFNNYIARELWNLAAPMQILSNFNKVDNTTQEGPNTLRWIIREGAEASNDAYDDLNYRYILFDQTPGGESLTFNNVVNGVTTFDKYGLRILQEVTQGQKVLYIMNGFGPFNNRIIALSKSAGTATTTEKTIAHYYIPPTSVAIPDLVADAVAGVDDAARQVQLRDRRSLLINPTVISLVESWGEGIYLDRTLLVGGTRAPDLRNTEIWSFHVNGIDATVLVTTIVNGVSASSSYRLDMLYNSIGTYGRAAFRLEGVGPLNNKYFSFFFNNRPSAIFEEYFSVIEQPDAATAISEGETDVVNETDLTTYHQRAYVNINWDLTLNELSSKGQLVTLNTDSVYKDWDTREIRFIAAGNQVQIITRTGTADDIQQTVDTYFLNPARVSSGVDGSYGAFLLKGANGTEPFDNQYLDVTIDSSGTDAMYGRLTLGSLRGTGINSSFPRPILAVKSAVYFPRAESIIKTLATTGPTASRGNWSGLLDNYAIGTNETDVTNFQFNYETKELVITIGADRPGVTRTTYSAWYRVIHDESTPGIDLADNTKTVFQIVKRFISGGPSGSKTLPAALENSVWAIDLDNYLTPVGFKAKTIAGSFMDPVPAAADLTALLADRDALPDVNFLPANLFTIDRRSINFLNTVSPHFWTPVTELGVIDGSPTETQAGWLALYNSSNPADNAKATITYDLNPLNGASFATTGVGDGFNYAVAMYIAGTNTMRIGGSPGLFANRFLQLVRDDGQRFGVVRFGKQFAGATPAALSTVLTNEIIDKFHAFEVGTGANYYRAKFARGATPEEATVSRNALPFYNYGAYETIYSQGNRDKLVKWLSGDSATSPTPSDTWTVTTAQTASSGSTGFATGTTIQFFWNGTTIRNTDMRMQAIDPSGAISQYFMRPMNPLGDAVNVASGEKMVYAVRGFGPYDGKFIAFNMSSPSDTQRNARFYVGDFTSIGPDEWAVQTGTLVDQSGAGAMTRP